MNIYLFRRLILFVISLFINALGIAFITKASLGTSPITSVNYVLSMFTPLTMGQWTIIVNILFVFLELPLMRRKDLKEDLRIFLLQIPVSICFGLFIDVAMNMLYWLAPTDYLGKICNILIGCVILAAGITLEVKVNVAMMSGEFFVRVISRRFKKDFGYVKLGFDSTLVVLACVMSLVFLSGIRGVREGTILAALTVGPIVHFLKPYYRFLDKGIKDGKYADTLPTRASKNIVITIAREYGSGGHLLGEILAQRLGIKLYDKEFIRMAARESGIDENYILQNEQSIPSFWLKCIFSQNNEHALKRSLSKDDILFVVESKIIQESAAKESCVIVGRCADYVLKDYPYAIRVFCYSDPESACERCVKEYGIPREKAASEIKRINRNRIAHYEYYTGQKWGEPHHYNLMVNTGSIGLSAACELIEDLYHNVEKKSEAAGGSK